MSEPQQADVAAVRTVGEAPQQWHLVTHGTWEVSVAPDGLIMFPRHIHPREITDFVAAMLAAAEVAEKVIAENTKNTTQVDLDNLPSDQAIVTQGEPPPGAVRMTVTEAGRAAAMIGRPKGRDVRQPRTTPPPLPPRGARYGRTRQP